MRGGGDQKQLVRLEGVSAGTTDKPRSERRDGPELAGPPAVGQLRFHSNAEGRYRRFIVVLY